MLTYIVNNIEISYYVLRFLTWYLIRPAMTIAVDLGRKATKQKLGIYHPTNYHGCLPSTTDVKEFLAIRRAISLNKTFVLFC